MSEIQTPPKLTEKIRLMKPIEPLPVGRSVEGREINLTRIGSGPIPVLLIGGVHGDEGEGVHLVERFEIFARDHYRNPRLSLYVLPELNPDGVEKGQRQNARGVDLNRNLPTKDWDPRPANPRYAPGPYPGSEPENQVLMAVIDVVQPILIISVHSYKKTLINTNGSCEDVALEMQKANGVEIHPEMGYPTPGSLGTYAGMERKIPTITLELLKGGDLHQLWEKHRGALTSALNLVTAPVRGNA